MTSSEITDIERFNDSHKLCAYTEDVPSVRNFVDTIHHGFITKQGWCIKNTMGDLLDAKGDVRVCGKL